MKPGARIRPSASMTRRAGPRIRPIWAMRPSATPTSARNRGAPEPSTTSAPRIDRSRVMLRLPQRALASAPVCILQRQRRPARRGAAICRARSRRRTHTLCGSPDARNPHSSAHIRTDSPRMTVRSAAGRTLSVRTLGRWGGVSGRGPRSPVPRADGNPGQKAWRCRYARRSRAAARLSATTSGSAMRPSAIASSGVMKDKTSASCAGARGAPPPATA